MPGPNPFPCGGPGQPACPPQNALLTMPDGSQVKVKVHKANGRHFIEEILDEIEAKIRQ